MPVQTVGVHPTSVVVNDHRWSCKDKVNTCNFSKMFCSFGDVSVSNFLYINIYIIILYYYYNIHIYYFTFAINNSSDERKIMVDFKH